MTERDMMLKKIGTLKFAVTDKDGDGFLRMTESGAVCATEGVTELATFGNDAGSEGAGMAGEAIWPGEIFANIFDTGGIVGDFFIDLLEIMVEEKIGLESGKTVAGTEDELKIAFEGLAESLKVSLKVRIDDINTRASPPVSEETRLDVISGKRVV